MIIMSSVQCQCTMVQDNIFVWAGTYSQSLVITYMYGYITILCEGSNLSVTILASDSDR